MLISQLTELEELSFPEIYKKKNLRISDKSLLYLRRLNKLKKLRFEIGKYMFSSSCFMKLIVNLKMMPMVDYSE